MFKNDINKLITIRENTLLAIGINLTLLAKKSKPSL
jgi:hypothetical protein